MATKPSMNLETVCKLAAEVEASDDGWRPVKMQRHEKGWRLYVERDEESSMSLAWYEPWPVFRAQFEAEEKALVAEEYAEAMEHLAETRRVARELGMLVEYRPDMN